ncbi:tetratricopeptide repeat protein [Xanthocytophaga flava]|uniref:tetratricopeptide repeat protein n=1 Tax=Xanthocytophaga flava TaxID=3048013 RepID=UPI0028D8EAA7|nr:tetratricopeptide repeat protein [Xanthocytophaga flavus]MDJ1467705.1 tetratricopeptide repeat protein [Xanthocytophaga flavus]
MNIEQRNNILSKARILKNLKRYDLAEAELRRLLVDDPEDAEVLKVLAIKEIEQQRYYEAQKYVSQLAGLVINDAYVHYLQAILHLTLQKNTEAEKSIREALTLQPEEPIYYGILAEIFVFQKNWEQVLLVTASGLTFDADNLHCLLLRAWALSHNDRREEAEEVMKKLLSLGPDQSEVICYIGKILYTQKRFDEAYSYFQNALQLDPSNEEARVYALTIRKHQNWLFRNVTSYIIKLPYLFGILPKWSRWLIRLSVGAGCFYLLQGYGLWIQIICACIMAISVKMQLSLYFSPLILLLTKVSDQLIVDDPERKRLAQGGKEPTGIVIPESFLCIVSFVVLSCWIWGGLALGIIVTSGILVVGVLSIFTLFRKKVFKTNPQKEAIRKQEKEAFEQRRAEQKAEWKETKAEIKQEWQTAKDEFKRDIEKVQEERKQRNQEREARWQLAEDTRKQNRPQKSILRTIGNVFAWLVIIKVSMYILVLLGIGLASLFS